MNQNRLLVIGLDGATLDLIKNWSDQGLLPNIKYLLDNGAHAKLQSTIPTISPAAWTTFMTGKNPGKHGIYDFIRRRSNSYQLIPARNNLSKINTIFRQISNTGRRVAVINVPLTYPPEQLNGVMVSGLGAPDNDSFAMPTELVQELKREGYTVNNALRYTPESAETYLTYLMEITQTRFSTVMKILTQEAWDFFMYVFRDIDTVQSFFWHDYDPNHPLHDPKRALTLQNAMLHYHQLVDSMIGDMINGFGLNANIIVMSDHGNGPLYKEVHLNNWLAQNNFLTFKKTLQGQDYSQKILRRFGITKERVTQIIGWHRVEALKQRLPVKWHSVIPSTYPSLTEKVDWIKTQAYSYGHVGQIYINLRGREPQGIVNPGAEYDKVVEEISSALLSLIDVDDGLPVVSDIFHNKLLYHGIYAQNGPDIVVHFRNLEYTSDAGSEFASKDILSSPRSDETGFHRLEGLLIACGPDIKPSLSPQNAHIQDLAPTILSLYQIAIPSDCDGVVLESFLYQKDILLTNHSDTPTVHSQNPYENESDIEEQIGLSESEEQEIVENLRRLGYL